MSYSVRKFQNTEDHSEIIVRVDFASSHIAAHLPDQDGSVKHVGSA